MRRPTTAAARESIRAHNQNAVLQTVHRHGPISRVDLAARLQLSPAAITSITGELIDRNLLFEARRAETTGAGRRPILLEVDYDHALVAGVKLSRDRVVTALTNLNAEIHRSDVRPLERTDPEAVVEAIARSLAELADGTPEGAAVAALAVSVPGTVDIDGSTVRRSPFLGWRDVPLGALLEERLGAPVVVENDVDALALAEAWFGCGREHDDLLVVTLGRGVGLGIVLHGEVYRGPRGGAGELGHVVLDPAGPAARRGRPATLEAFLSDDALLRAARRALPDLPDDATVEDAAARARTGEAAARAVYERAGVVLGRALALLVNIFAPELIVLGGEGMRSAAELLPAARRELAAAAFGDLGERVELVVDVAEDDSWARGAAALAASRHLVDVAMQAGGDRV